jgi:hypothetical protein
MISPKDKVGLRNGFHVCDFGGQRQHRLDHCTHQAFGGAGAAYLMS